MVAYEGFTEVVLERKTTSLILIDDCGNKWNYILIFGMMSYNHYRIGSDWKRMVSARRIKEGKSIRLGALIGGNNKKVYISLDRWNVF
jgi:hypothetical protein